MRSNSKLVLMALMGVLVLSALGATAASASTSGSPYFSVAGKRLGAGEEKTFSLSASKQMVMGIPAWGVTITCSKAGVKSGASIIGSAAPGAGTAKETLEFSNCRVSGNGECTEVKTAGEPWGTIQTKPLASRLAFEGRSSEESTGRVITVFKPEKGEEFAKLEMGSNGKCTFSELPLDGEYAGRSLNGSQKNIEQGGPVQESKEGFLEFPETRIVRACKEDNTTSSGCAEVKQLTDDGTAAKFTALWRTQLTGEPLWTEIG